MQNPGNMDVDGLAALALSATDKEMALLLQKMTDLVADRTPLDERMGKMMDTAESIKQCLGHMNQIQEETARIKNANASEVRTM